MKKFEEIIKYLSGKANSIAAIAVFLMMLLTVIDVILRFFKMPIPGTYEIVGLLGSLAISFSLAYTSMEKGHIAVEFIVQKLPARAKIIISACNEIISAILFIMITWRLFIYGNELRASGEVSATLQLATYPFAYGIALGSLLLSILLILEFYKSLRGIEKQ